MTINDVPSDVLMLAEELFPTEEGFWDFFYRNHQTTVEGKVDWIDLAERISAEMG